MKRLIIIALAALSLASCGQKPAEPKVMARYVPERSDDFVFENNLICGRIYGKALEGNPTSPGIDIWVKTPGALVADQRYKDELEGGRSYHIDWGNGKDCYKVAVSLGGGASAPLVENRMQYPATNYREWEILEQTPEKVVFVLSYPEWQIDSILVSLDKKITVTADSYFCKVEDSYSFSGAESLQVAAGIFLHPEQQTVVEQFVGTDRYAIWEHASDQSVEPEDGMLGVAVFAPGAEFTGCSHGDDHGICVKTVKSGEVFTYYFGSCWSKGDIKTAGDWFEIVKDLALSPEQRADELIGRLTLEQKASLMVNDSQAIPELGIRKYNWWNEALHGAARAGLATSFPQAIAMASSWDPELLREVFDIASTEQRIKFIESRRDNDYALQYHGLTVWTPNINIFRDPRWGRGQETYGEDPYLTYVMGRAVVEGLQGEPDEKGYDKLHACLKHYAVHSGPESTRHSFDAEGISWRDLMETYLYAFENIVKTTDVHEVMCAYNAFDGKPCCGSDKLLTQLLRGKWGYKGLVVSDCGAVDDFYSEHGHQTFPGDPVSATANAVRTGTDLECGDSYYHLVEGVKQGRISEEEINVSLRRLLTARFRLGEMDDDSLVSWNSIPVGKLACPEHHAKAVEMCRESIVLLQNDGILPLAEGTEVMVAGPNAADASYPLGNYEGTPAHVTTALEGISARYKVCEDADIVFYVGGINPRLEGEEMDVKVEGFLGGDRTSLELPRDQREEIAALAAAGKKVIFVCMSGSAMGLVPESEVCSAIVEAWYGGEAAGEGLADVLCGAYNPAGRLPVTFYRSVDDLPDFSDYDMEGRTYRYFKGEPLWAFGHGLSYTTFKYKKARYNAKKGEIVIKVRNKGKRDGDEVVQVYVGKEEDAEGPVYALRGFKRVNIPAGKTVKVTIPLDDMAFTTFDPESGEMTATPGHFTVNYGGSSARSALKTLKVTRK